MTDKDKLKSPAEGATVSDTDEDGLLWRLRNPWWSHGQGESRPELARENIETMREAARFIQSTEGEIQRLQEIVRSRRRPIARARSALSSPAPIETDGVRDALVMAERLLSPAVICASTNDWGEHITINVLWEGGYSAWSAERNAALAAIQSALHNPSPKGGQ